MQINPNSEVPIFMQIASGIQDGIMSGAFPEEEQIPSTTEISARYKINPATILKGMNLLVDEGVLYKKRGLGMFVKEGAIEQIRGKRQKQFFEDYIVPLVSEAQKLGIREQEVLQLMKRGYEK